MFDLDEFLSGCREAVRGDEPLLAVRELLARAVKDPAGVTAALPPTRAEVVALYADDEVTVLKAVWAPGMRIRPHNHLMWAAIGLYGGKEDNTFFRRAGGHLEVSGGRVLSTGDVALLGDDMIHSVSNPSDSLSGAIHVYGGDLTRIEGRSEWDDSSGEVPFDFAATVRYFDEANQKAFGELP